ncbi:putative transcriptional regulatory protein pdtaR [Rhodobacteraceae bacterium THAF1]|uniref:response regulator n=1 Tax=Palleronia sp. THAF1 TaxID=2587842 RepID=UPI000F3F7336|nr:response regulator [Palleronia sp. THAF1]QFU07192.1 putative transcriptional regulatory protein pdtaR [Palleronia sp. THAF1]VDC16574.1 putative transcriptional regulatory protein pdtaR [Rhodobacteraceae bacterium THAF1]
MSNDTGIGLRVLIVEDNIFIALDLEAQLVELGHEVVGIAATATKAIDMSRQSSPDIAIVDLQLANGSKGQDAALVLRSEMEIPSVFVSGSLHQVTDAEKEAIRPLAMLSKPLLPNELRRTLEDAVNSDLVGQNR